MTGVLLVLVVPTLAVEDTSSPDELEVMYLTPPRGPGVSLGDPEFPDLGTLDMCLACREK